VVVMFFMSSSNMLSGGADAFAQYAPVNL